MKAKKSLGQNFLISDQIKKDIVSLIDSATEDDLVIEIGPGRGAITKYLTQLDSNIICIEIDRDMNEFISKYESPKVRIIYDDILNIDLKQLTSGVNYKRLFVVGNLPYYITGPIMEHIINSGVMPNEMVFMVQKEVGERYTAKVHTKEYGYMTLFLDFFYRVSKEISVPRIYFNPVPKVDSCVIKLTKRNIQREIEAKEYFKFLKECFKYKRKTLNNNLKGYNLSIDKKLRAEELSQEEFIELYKSIKK